MSPHYKSLLDPAKFLNEADFPPAGREVTIDHVAREKMPERQGEAAQFAPMLYIKAKDGTPFPRPYKLPKSVMFGLSLLLGNETDDWKDKKITIFSAHCMSFGEKEPCLRVKFPPEIEQRVRAWLKKRKVNPAAYILEDRK